VAKGLISAAKIQRALRTVDDERNQRDLGGDARLPQPVLAVSAEYGRALFRVLFLLVL